MAPPRHSDRPGLRSVLWPPLFDGAVSARLEVVPGMGTGGLEGLVGEAEPAIAGHSDDGYDLVLAYDIG